MRGVWSSVGLLLLGSILSMACAAEPAPTPFQSGSSEAASDDGNTDGSHAKSGTAPAPSSSVAQPVIPATPPADDTPVTPAAIDSKWSGTLAKTSAVTFGGSPYCTYRTHLENVVVNLTTDPDGVIKGATVTGKAIEEALNNCPNKPIPANNHLYSFVPTTAITGGFTTEGAAANQPRALLNATVKADNSASTGTVTLAIHRDDIGSPFDWTITAAVPVTKK
jgi:hypothetical protein